MNASSSRAAVRRTVGGVVAGLVLALAPATAAYAASTASVTPPPSPTTYTSYDVEVAATSETTAPTRLVLLDGTTPIGTLSTCDGVALTCTGTLPWIPTSAGPASLTVEAYDDTAVPSPVLLVASDPVSVTVTDAPSPTASITTAGGTLSAATTTLDVTATTGGQTDTPTTIQLLQDGSPVGSPLDCGTHLVGNVCSGTIDWLVPTDKAGQTYTLTAEVTTDASRTGTSAGVGFATPAPQVSITAPADGATVRTTTPTITATASTADWLTDLPKDVQLKVGVTDVGTAVSCTGHLTGNVCTVDLPGAIATQSGDRSLTAVVTTLGGATTLSDATNVTVDLPPTVTIDLPADGSTVTGVTAVRVVASTDAGAGSDVPATVTLTANGDAVAGSPFDCSSHLADRTCTIDTTVDTAALGSSVTLSAAVTTSLGDTATSEDVVVGVDIPTATITSIFDGSVSGVTAVDAQASTGATSPDFPDYMELYDGATLVDTQECVNTEHDCSVTFSWDTTLLDGERTLVAKVITVGSLANAAVTVPSPSKKVTVLTAPTHVSVGSVTGPVVGTFSVPVSASTDAGTTHYPASIALLVDGSPVGTPVTCAVQVHDCSGSVSWDATGLTGSHDLTAVVTTTVAANGAAAAAPVESAVVTVTASTPAPTVAVSVSPISGSTVKGLVTVSVTATSDGRLTDRKPLSITLSSPGGTLTPSGLTQTCGGTASCTKTWSWDTTALSGAKTITASASFDNTPSPVQGTKAVTVANPLPSVAFTSPSSGTVITKTTTIKISASTDSSTTDFPKTLQMLVNGSVKASKACTTTVHTCTASFSWSPGTLDGPQAFTARITTLKGAVRTTATRTYYAYYRSTTSSTSISTLSTVITGTRVTIKGKVIATKTGAGVGGITVRITRDPAIGTTATSSVTTSSSGAFSFSFTARNNTVVTARALSKTYNGSTWFTGSSRTARQLVRATMTCTIVDASLSKGQTGQGSCVVPDLPVGTPLTLTYTISGRTTTLASGRSKSTTISFTFVFPARGTYVLRVNLSANAVFAATSSPGLTVTQA